MSTSRAPRRESIITGDAIELEVQPAAIPLRLLAQLIDAAAWVTLALLAVWVLANSDFELNDAQIKTLVIIGVATVTFGLPLVAELLTGGRSPGKLAVGIRVLRADGGPVRLRHVFIRQLVGVVENWGTFGAVASITSMLNARGQRLGDMLAGTYCVRLRGSDDAPYPLIMPPELARWAAKADIAPIPSSLTIRARSFLNRAATLGDVSRAQLAVRLADELATYVQPLPPPDTHPERFLAAVIVQRRDEEYRRYVAQNRRQAR